MVLTNMIAHWGSLCSARFAWVTTSPVRQSHNQLEQLQRMTQEIAFNIARVEPALYWKATKAAVRVRGKDKSRQWIWKVAAWFALVFLLTLLMRLDVVREAERAVVVGAFIAGCVVTAAIQLGNAWLLRARLKSSLEQTQSLHGSLSVEFGPEGCVFNSAVSHSTLKWRAVDEILDLRTGTGLRSGLLVYPLPNEALPDGMSPPDFRQNLEEWRAAS